MFVKSIGARSTSQSGLTGQHSHVRLLFSLLLSTGAAIRAPYGSGLHGFSPMFYRFVLESGFSLQRRKSILSLRCAVSRSLTPNGDNTTKLCHHLVVCMEVYRNGPLR